MRQPVTTVDIRRDLVGLLPRLRRFALTLSGDAQGADELVQAVCQRAVAKSNQWKGTGRLESWIYGLARQSHAEDSRKRWPRRPPSLQSGGNVTDIRDLRERAAAKDADSLHRLLADMPEGISSVFLLVSVEGYSYEEAAAVMGTSPSLVASQLSAARLHLAGVADAQQNRV